MKRTFEYRLYPNRRQAELLMSCLIHSRHLYNEMLERVKHRYAGNGTFIFRTELCALFKGRGGDHVPQTTVQTLADRLDTALRRFITAKRSGGPAGFPRFKSPNRWHSIRLRRYGKGRDSWLEDGRLRVPGKIGKSIKIKLHRPLVGTPKTVHLRLRADGKWYALVVCDLGEVPEPSDGGKAVGVDVGLKVFLADSDGRKIENPRHHYRARKRLRRAQRRACRRKKGSKRRKKAARRVAKLHLKIARQRKDFLHKTARSYVEKCATIVVEDLRVANMVKNRRFALPIHDASWSRFVQMLEYKAEEAGARIIKVPPRLTSQRCSTCGEPVPKNLCVRTHVCAACGYVEDRDVNAARNILTARTGPSEPNVAGYRERAPRSRLF